MSSPQQPQMPGREVVVVTGISGSGKSVALHALEDAGYYCVDNVPPELLRDFMALNQARKHRRLALAIDVRSADSLPHLKPILAGLRSEGVQVRVVFLDANHHAIQRRYSESRRPHPLSEADIHPAGEHDPDTPTEHREHKRRALDDAVALERELLADVREGATIVDTSHLRPAQLRAWVSALVGAKGGRLTLVFESFAFKHGVPLDADLVFDVRVLPNPHYVDALRPLTGRDDAVANFLNAQPEVLEMRDQIETFVKRWLPSFERDQRSYLTVAIGCTGGQHRSVFLAEALAGRFADHTATLIRHRELESRE